MRTALVLCALFFGAVPALADRPAPADTTTTELPALRVRAEGSCWSGGLLSRERLQRHGGENLGGILADLPGVAAVRRAPRASEPVIRGLGWERVATVLGAVPLYGACPGRMDPPAAYLGAAAAAEVSVSRSGGAGALTAGATGGAVVIDPDHGPGAGGGFLTAGYDGAGDAYHVEGAVSSRRGRLDVRAGAGYRTAEDYTAPDGTVVPAGMMSASADLGMGWQADEDRRLWQTFNYVREEEVDFPSLPMDNIRTDFMVHNLGWEWQGRRNAWRGLKVTGGWSLVDHLMDNGDKANTGMMLAETNAETRTWGLHAAADLALGDEATLAFGLDATRLGRDALRTRQMVASGAVFRDNLWPDAVQSVAGGSIRLQAPLAGPRVRVTVSGRVDASRNEARAADGASLGGRTVREQYVRFYGADAAETDRDATLGQAALGLEAEIGAGLHLNLRAGASSRDAAVSERYYAFAPAPGGFQVGNPTLLTEKKREIELGLRFERATFAAGVNLHHSDLSDYILPVILTRTDVNGDTVPDAVKGFVNADAELTGGELSGAWRPTDHWRLPFSLAWVRGINTADGRDLPEIPPVSGDAAVRWLADAGRDAWLECGVRFAGDQERVDASYGEDRTGGWAVWRARLELQPADDLTVVVGVENLFDRQYHEHLMREAVLPTDSLVPGQEVPEPGRALRVSVRRGF